MKHQRQASENLHKGKRMNRQKIRCMLVLYDAKNLFFIDVLLLYVYKGIGVLTTKGILAHFLLSFVSVFLLRFVWKIYNQIWRYGGIQCYIRLLAADSCAFLLYTLLNFFLAVLNIDFIKLIAIFCFYCLGRYRSECSIVML